MPFRGRVSVRLNCFVHFFRRRTLNQYTQKMLSWSLFEEYNFKSFSSKRKKWDWKHGSRHPQQPLLIIRHHWHPFFIALCNWDWPSENEICPSAMKFIHRQMRNWDRKSISRRQMRFAYRCRQLRLPIWQWCDFTRDSVHRVVSRVLDQELMCAPKEKTQDLIRNTKWNRNAEFPRRVLSRCCVILRACGNKSTSPWWKHARRLINLANEDVNLVGVSIKHGAVSVAEQHS